VKRIIDNHLAGVIFISKWRRAGEEIRYGEKPGFGVSVASAAYQYQPVVFISAAGHLNGWLLNSLLLAGVMWRKWLNEENWPSRLVFNGVSACGV